MTFFLVMCSFVSTVIAMASNLLEIASNLIAMACNLLLNNLIPRYFEVLGFH